MADRGCGKTIYGTAEVCGDGRFCSLECFSVESCPHQQCWCRSRWFDAAYRCPEVVTAWAFSSGWDSEHPDGWSGWEPMEFPCAWPGRYDWDTGVLSWSWVAHDGRIVWGEW